MCRRRTWSVKRANGTCVEKEGERCKGPMGHASPRKCAELAQHPVKKANVGACTLLSRWIVPLKQSVRWGFTLETILPVISLLCVVYADARLIGPLVSNLLQGKARALRF